MPIDREIIFPLRYHSAQIGGTAVIRGYLYGFNFSTDAVEVRWYFEDRSIGTNSRLEMTTLFNFEYSFSINEVRANDFGSYTLEAKSRSRVYMDKTLLQPSSMLPACLFMYVFVCLYVCMYVCIYVCVYICVYVYMYVCMYVSMYACMYVCMHACMYVCVCMYVVDVARYTHKFACMLASMYVCTVRYVLIKKLYLFML